MNVQYLFPAKGNNRIYFIAIMCERVQLVSVCRMRNACQDLLCRLMNQSFDRWEYLVTLKYHIRYVCEKIKCFFGVLCSTAERKNCSLKAAVALGDFRIELSRLRARKVVT